MEKVMDMLFLVIEIQGGHENSFGHTYIFLVMGILCFWKMVMYVLFSNRYAIFGDGYTIRSWIYN